MSKIMQFLKQATIKTGLFLRANWAYILWGIAHIALATATLQVGFQDIGYTIRFVLMIYAISIGIALSPLGEFVMRSLERARPVETKRDKEYLMPLFEEVYEQALLKTPSLNKKIRLYITESKEVNAFAIGRKTVMLTRGAVTSLPPDGIKGIIAHELGHMASGDTMARLIVIVGNGFFSAIVLICKTIMLLYGLLAAALSRRPFLTLFVGFFVNLLFNYLIGAFLFMGNVILALNSRYREFLADNYAYQIGYGEELKDALYQINAIDIGGKRNIKEWLKASHPHTTARIAKLEQKLDEEET